MPWAMVDRHSAPRELAAPGLPRLTRPAVAVEWPLAGPRERARQQVVGLVLALFLIALAEGAVRKWLLPQYSQYLFFLRDPVLLLAYALAFAHRLWPRRSLPLMLAWLALASGVVLGLLQAAVGPYNEWRLLLGLYGWRAYFLYLPLMFLVGQVFAPQDLRRLFTWMLVLMMPTAVLVALQFAADPDAAINVGIATERALQFRGLGLTAERTRPMGPFASVAGQQQFVASSFAVLLAWFIAPSAVAKPALAFRLVAAAALATCVAFSGSRGTVLQCALSLVVAVLLVVAARTGALRLRALLVPLVLALSAVLLYPLLFPSGFDAFSERWAVAHRIESRTYEAAIFGRALYGLVDFVRLLDTVPMLGYGLGFGGNASWTLGITLDGLKPSQLAETDFSRHMVDLGPLAGLAYIAMRLALTVWLALRVWRATRRAADPMPWLLFSYAGYVLVFGQITGQGTINFFGWLFAGLVLAACRASDAQATPAGSHRRHGAA